MPTNSQVVLSESLQACSRSSSMLDLDTCGTSEEKNLQKGSLNRTMAQSSTTLDQHSDSHAFMTKSLPLFPTDFQDCNVLEKLNSSIQSLADQINAAGEGDDDSIYEVADDTMPVKTAVSDFSSVENLSNSGYATPEMFFVDKQDEITNFEDVNQFEPNNINTLQPINVNCKYREAEEHQEDVWECGVVDMNNMSTGSENMCVYKTHATILLENDFQIKPSAVQIQYATLKMQVEAESVEESVKDISNHVDSMSPVQGDIADNIVVSKGFDKEEKCMLNENDSILEVLNTSEERAMTNTNSNQLKSFLSDASSLVDGGMDLIAEKKELIDEGEVAVANESGRCDHTFHCDVVENDIQEPLNDCQMLSSITSADTGETFLQDADNNKPTTVLFDNNLICNINSDSTSHVMYHSAPRELDHPLWNAWTWNIGRAVKRYVSITEKKSDRTQVAVQQKLLSWSSIDELAKVELVKIDWHMKVTAPPSVTTALKLRYDTCQRFSVDVFNCGELWKEGDICEEYTPLHQVSKPKIFSRATELPRQPRIRYDHTHVNIVEVFGAGIESNSLLLPSLLDYRYAIKYADILEEQTTLPKGMAVEYFLSVSLPKVMTLKGQSTRIYHKPLLNWVYKHQVKVYEAAAIIDSKSDRKTSNSSKNNSEKKAEKKPIIENEPKVSRVQAIMEKAKADAQKLLKQNIVQLTKPLKLGANQVKSKGKSVASAENVQSSFHNFQKIDDSQVETVSKDQQREEKKKLKLETVEKEVEEKAKKRELERQRAAEERRKRDAEREAQKAAVRAAAQQKLKEKFELNNDSNVKVKPVENRKNKEIEKTSSTSHQMTHEKNNARIPAKVSVKDPKVSLSTPNNGANTNTEEVNIIDSQNTKNLRLQSKHSPLHRMAQSSPDLLKRISPFKEKFPPETDNQAEYGYVALQSSDDESSMADSWTSDYNYDSDNSSTPSFVKPHMYR